MRAVRWLPVIAVVIILLLAATLAGEYTVRSATGGAAGSYHLRIAMADANQVYSGMPIQIKGQNAGKVTSVTAQGDTAIVTVALRPGKGPLHDGTTASVQWQSLLSQHYVSLVPGPASGGLLPSGSLIQNDEQVTVQDLLNMLNGPTRTALAGVINNLQKATQGHATDLQNTLSTAAPTINALQQVLDAAGEDGPALDNIVNNLEKLTSALAGRQDQLSGTVDNLATLMAAAGSQQQSLTEALQRLPGTLATAKSTLDAVPAATSTVNPLLTSLEPTAALLPATAADLSPVLTTLQPELPLLSTTLQSANVLLQNTPGLLSLANADLPGVTQAITALQPALNFLRPYAPEAVGFSQTFGGGFASYDANGHYLNALVSVGANAIEGNTVATSTPRPTPQPGENVGQTWTDAFGTPET